MIDATTGWYVVPATIKAVVISSDGRVLLARNPRGEWELPGGWPTREDETVGDVIQRELAEEASIEVDVGSLLHAELAHVGGHQVVIVAFRCSCRSTDHATLSDEHNALEWRASGDLADLDLIAPYATAIKLAFGTHP